MNEFRVAIRTGSRKDERITSGTYKTHLDKIDHIMGKKIQIEFDPYATGHLDTKWGVLEEIFE